MKWYKKAGFLLVAVASLLGLVACGQNNQSTDGKVTILTRRPRWQIPCKG